MVLNKENWVDLGDLPTISGLLWLFTGNDLRSLLKSVNNLLVISSWRSPFEFKSKVDGHGQNERTLGKSLRVSKETNRIVRKIERSWNQKVDCPKFGHTLCENSRIFYTWITVLFGPRPSTSMSVHFNGRPL